MYGVNRVVRSVRWCIVWSVVGWVSIGALEAQLPNQPIPTDSQWHYRFDLFQMLFEERGLQLMSSLDSTLRLPPSETIVILTGNSLSTRLSDRIRNHVLNGGNVLIATDEWMVLPQVAVINDGPVTSNDKSVRYQSFADCLRVDAIDRQHPIMEGVSTIVTNRSGYLLESARSSFQWTTVASLPERCLPEEASGQPLIIVGKGDRPTSGVLIIMADASLFTNNMLWHGDNGVLATNVCQALNQGNRKYLVVVNDGRSLPSIRSQFTPKLPPFSPPQTPPNMPEPDLATMLEIANSVAKNVAESNLLNEALRNQPRGVSQYHYLSAVAWSLLIATCLYLLWQAWRRWPSVASTAAQRKMRSTLEMVSDGPGREAEYRRAAVDLSREFCFDWMGTGDILEWRHRRTAIQEGLFQPSIPMETRKSLIRVLDLAIDGLTGPIQTRQLQEIGRMIHRLRVLVVTEPHSSMKFDLPPLGAV